MALCAHEIMQTQVVTVSPDDPLDSVRRLFADEGISGAPVVDDDARVLGVISSTDLLRASSDDIDAERPEEGYFQDGVETFDADQEEEFAQRLGQHRVADVMSDGVVAVAPDTAVLAVAQTIRSNQVHRVLVVEDGFLRGIISSFDLVGLLEKMIEE